MPKVEKIHELVKAKDSSITHTFMVEKKRSREGRAELGIEFGDDCLVTCARVGTGVAKGDRIAAVDGDTSNSAPDLALRGRMKGRRKFISVQRA